MDQNSINRLLERRVQLLQELANSLQCAHAALLLPDYTQIRLHTKAQQDLCQELRRLASESRPAQVASWSDAAAASKAASNVRRKTLATELQGLQARVAALNRRYGALLRRAQRTVNIFNRVLQNFELTYVVPRAHPASDMQYGG